MCLKKGVDKIEKEEEKMFNRCIFLVPYVYNHVLKGKKEHIKDDLLQAGYLALWDAVRFFDKTRNVKFSTYAFKAIFFRMKRYLWLDNRYYSKTVNHIKAYREGDNIVKLDVFDIIGEEDDTIEKMFIEDMKNSIKNKKTLKKGRYDEIVELFFQGKPPREIAEKTGINRHSVRQKICRIKKELFKNFMQKIDYETLKQLMNEVLELRSANAQGVKIKKEAIDELNKCIYKAYYIDPDHIRIDVLLKR